MSEIKNDDPATITVENTIQSAENNETVVNLSVDTDISTSSQSLPVISTTSTPLNTLASTQDLSTIDEMNNNNISNSSLRSHSLFPSLRFTRDIIERRQRSSWRENINTVFQEIRPLVQNSHQSTSSSFLTTFMPQNRNYRMSTTSNDLHQQNSEVRASNDSITINMGIEPSPSTSTISRDREGVLNTTATSTGTFINYGVNERSNSLQQSQSSLHDASGRQSIQSASNINILNQESGENNPNNSGGADEADPNSPDSITQIPEARKFIETLCRYFPYILILFAKSCYDHLDGILDIFALFVTFAHSNFVLRQEILKQGSRRVLVLIRELIYIILVIVIIGFMLEKNNTLINLIFKPFESDEEFTLKKMLFSVILTDLILKLFTVGIKIIFTLLPVAVCEYKNRGRIYLMMEAISQLYRALAPIQSWLFFLLDSYKGTEKIMGVILAAAYMVAKGSDLLQRAKFCKRSFVKLLQKTSFGITPTKEQIQQAGGICSICHDNYSGPVMLECNHIFCELCVGTWFDRERSCPLCRAVVVDSPEYRDGSTTFFIQFY